MKNKVFAFAFAASVILWGVVAGFTTKAAPADTINRGIFIGDVNVSGMSVSQARDAVNSYVDSLKSIPITLHVNGDNTVETTAGELGLKWSNPEAAEDALSLGKQGNVLRRFREAKGLSSTERGYEIHLAFDDAAMDRVFEEKCAKYDAPATQATMRRENGKFIIEGGEPGVAIDREASKKVLKKLLQNGWTGSRAEANLVVSLDTPKGSREELEKLTDVLGTFTTKFTSSGADRSANVTNGCAHINGTLLFPGEEFSAYKTVSPFSEANGYHMAGSYMNGIVVDSLGGGICQVSTTLYNAVLKAELEVVERHNHSMEVNYVKPSADAAIAESAGKDFRFKNSTSNPIYIEGLIADKTITFNIYGVETRPSSHTVEFESEILSETVPEGVRIVKDPSHNIGYFHNQSPHIGRKAKLWKIVKEDGKEVSREVVNNSNYNASPKTVTVGTATSDSTASATFSQAIATNDLDHIKATASAIQSGNSSGVSQPAVDPELLAMQQALAAMQAAQAAIPPAVDDAGEALAP